MNQVLRILSKVGEYVYKNSIWLIPIIDTTIQAVKKLIKRKQNDRRIESENQDGGGEVGSDSGLCPDSVADKQ